MRTLCGHARNDSRRIPGLREETKQALLEHAPNVTLRQCDDGETYVRALIEFWEPVDDLLVVEHDIVFEAENVAALEECPEPWCGFVYSISTQYKACLGFTRFRRELIEAVPDAMQRAAEGRYDKIDPSRVVPDGERPFAWVRQDTRLAAVLENAGYTLHEHWPPVEHLNPAQRYIGDGSPVDRRIEVFREGRWMTLATAIDTVGLEPPWRVYEYGTLVHEEAA